MIFLIEKEFHFGPITDDTPVLKILNLIDEENVKRYKKDTDAQTSKGKGSAPQLLG